VLAHVDSLTCADLVLLALALVVFLRLARNRLLGASVFGTRHKELGGNSAGPAIVCCDVGSTQWLNLFLIAAGHGETCARAVDQKRCGYSDQRYVEKLVNQGGREQGGREGRPLEAAVTRKREVKVTRASPWGQASSDGW